MNIRKQWALLCLLTSFAFFSYGMKGPDPLSMENLVNALNDGQAPDFTALAGQFGVNLTPEQLAQGINLAGSGAGTIDFESVLEAAQKQCGGQAGPKSGAKSAALAAAAAAALGAHASSGSDSSQPGADDIDVDQLMADIDIPGILASVDGAEIARQLTEQQKQEAREKDQQIRAYIKKQNTILFGDVRWPVALYKGDVVAGAFLVAQLGLEYFVYTRILNARIGFLEQSIKAHSGEFLTVLKAAQEALKTVPKVERKTWTQWAKGEKTQREKALDPVREFMLKNQNYIGYNPFKKDILLPLIFEYIAQAILIALEKEYVLKGTSFLSEYYNALSANGSSGISSNIFRKESHLAYVKGPNGELIESKKVPFSALHLLKLVIAPRLMVVQNTGKINVTGLKFINKLFNLGLPEWMYSEKVEMASQIAILGLSVKLFDMYMRMVWTNYVCEHIDDCIKYVEKAKADYKDPLQKQMAQLQLRKFIEEGHKSAAKSMLPLVDMWMSRKNIATAQVQGYLAWPVALLAAFKGGKLLYNMYS